MDTVKIYVCVLINIMKKEGKIAEFDYADEIVLFVRLPKFHDNVLATQRLLDIQFVNK